MKIEDLEKALQYFVIAVPESEEQAKAYFWARKALTALRSMREAGEPLSLEQLQEMDGKPVWIVEYPDWGHWELSEDANDYIVDRNLNFYGMKHDDPDGRYGLHKLGWLAYSYPPAHIDRSKWEPCAVCENETCRTCINAGMVSYGDPCCECDATASGGSYYEPSNFCPHCGRPLAEEAWAELERRVRG